MLFTTDPVFKIAESTHSTTHHFLERDVRCVTVAGLILLKLYALPSLYCQGNGARIGLYENDIFMLVERYEPDLQPLLRLLEPHLEEGQMLELRNITDDIRRRVDRVKRNKA